MPLGLRKKKSMETFGWCWHLQGSLQGEGPEGEQQGWWRRRRHLQEAAPREPTARMISQAVPQALTADWGGWVCSEIGGLAVALGELMGICTARGPQEPVVAAGDFSLAV